MNKKSWYYCIGCLVAGFAVGYFYMENRDGQIAAKTFATLKIIDLGESDERALKAYQHESIPVAIYAMTELLDKQKAAEQVGGTAFMSKQMISIDLMLTHTRLAKLYTAAGQTNLSAEHIEQALSYAKTDRGLTITNRDGLMDFVAKVDKGVQ